jgi:hypothetical protein
MSVSIAILGLVLAAAVPERRVVQLSDNVTDRVVLTTAEIDVLATSGKKVCAT